jgi:hypothetical protein
MNGIKDKNHIIISTEAKKSLPQNSTTFYDKALKKARNKNNIIKAGYYKPIVNIILK